MSKRRVNRNHAEKTGERELKSSLDFTKTKTDHFAVFFIGVLGSMQFLIGSILFFVVWICWNLHFFPIAPFDPFPFPILEMLVSLFAIVLSVSVLINQNRQGRIEKIKQHVDFEINVRAESEITRVLNMVHEIHQKLGLKNTTDAELESMKKETDLKKIHHTIDEVETDESKVL